MPVPPVEFPPTYYSESHRMAARERPPVTVDYPIDPAPRTPLFPRLTSLLRGDTKPAAADKPATAP